jgi:flagellar motor switch protein FliN/FliY
MTRDDIVKRFIAELTRIVSAVLDTSASTRVVAPLESDGFVARVTAREGEHGALYVHYAREGAEALVGALSARPGAESGLTVVETLHRISNQAAASLDRRAVGAELEVESVEPCQAGAHPQNAYAIEIVLNGHDRPLHVVFTGDLEFIETPDGRRVAHSRTLDVIMDIDLPLVVRFGRTELPLKALTALGPGSVIDLGRSPDEPVDILISDRVVARGEVVIVSGHYGVRVRDVVSPVERARSLEADLP